MAFREEIGVIAGKIWTYLNGRDGFTDVLRLKFDLKLTNTELYLGLGWLAREEKIEFAHEGPPVQVRLKTA